VGGTGEQRRPLGLEGSPIEAPNGAIVLADDTGRVQSIAPDGSVNWATSISDDDRGSHGTPAIADGSLYVGTYDGVVSAVALDDGEILWQTDAGDAAAASPTYLDGKLYVAIEHATPSGSVVKMDAESGGSSGATSGPPTTRTRRSRSTGSTAASSSAPTTATATRGRSPSWSASGPTTPAAT